MSPIEPLRELEIAGDNPGLRPLIGNAVEDVLAQAICNINTAFVAALGSCLVPVRAADIAPIGTTRTAASPRLIFRAGAR